MNLHCMGPRVSRRHREGRPLRCGKMRQKLEF
jgi:hypothetical protein